METYKVTLFAGTGEKGRANEHRLFSSFGYLYGICVDKQGVIYASDRGNKLIQVIHGDQVTDLITKDKVGLQVVFGVCIGKDGNLYFTDYTRHVIGKVMDGKAMVFAGSLERFRRKQCESSGQQGSDH